ncbi:MAG: hypothetical protein H5T69_05070 [Chloroflexi bacterium]|nr:hypothetical protein [Chloroflexota bacterium]
MSYRRALDAIHLRLGEGLAQQENLDHPTFIAQLIGRDPWQDPEQAYIDAYKALDIDWVLGINRSRASRDAFCAASSIALDDGARLTEWGLSGSYWREQHPFADVEDVWRYDPLVNKPFLSFVTVESGRQNLERVREMQAKMGDAALLSVMRYPTLFTACIQAFGWPLFMTAAAADPARFEPILHGFAEVSRRIIGHWAAERWPLILIHDDIAMQHGLVFHPRWYRQHIYPLYEYLLEPALSEPQVRVCFVSDGDYSVALPDLLSLGFHGFFVNPNMDLAALSRAYGADHFIVGNIDTAVLTFGTPDEVQEHVRRCVEAAKPCAGHFIKAMGDLPHNIPLENLRAYFAACERYRRLS